MKRLVIFLFLMAGIASASVDVNNYTVEDTYAFSENIKGTVDLSIAGEYYDEKIDLSEGGGVTLGTFLEDNGVDFDCIPSDCSFSYSYSSGSSGKTISLSLLQDEYIGFVLTGGDIVLQDMDFRISSNFGESVVEPLSIEFFENEDWKFSVFSDNFLPKEMGCFDPMSKSVGPLIGNSFYCEMISIRDTDVLRVGADITGNDNDELNMVVYPKSGSGGSWECSYDPNIDDGCVVNPESGEIFSEGDYQVCVGADSLTSYKIYQDTSGEYCGFTYEDGPGSSVKDYGIFAQTVKYAGSSEMENISFDEGYIDAANDIISNKYDGNCEDGCVLPLKIRGISQNFKIYDIVLTYTDNSEWRSDNLVYDLERKAAKVNFDGTLDLVFLNLDVSESGEYYARLSGEYLFEVDIEVLDSPIIKSVLPVRDVPAGVPVTFYAIVDYSDENASLDYSWDFGDDDIVETEVPYIVHTYSDLGNYDLTLQVSAGGDLDSEKVFEIEVISPEDAIDARLDEWDDALDKVRTFISGLFVWYEDDLIDFIKLDFFESELSRLREARDDAFDDEDFIDVASQLYALDVPVLVGSNDFSTPFLTSEVGDVHVGPVAIFSGNVTGAKDNDYAKPILTWQNNNIDTSMKRSDVFVSYWRGAKEDILTAYSFDVTSRSNEESYFVINKPIGELHFNGVGGARKSGDATIVVLAPGETKSFEFYYEGGEDGSFFVSPRLSSIVVEADIDTDCNFDLVCDEEAGENSDNCRSDCKPVGWAVTFFILLLIAFFVGYSVLQIWYKKHYEGYLFRDKAQMYNLLMYVTNARARGVTDHDIGVELRAKGWSSERVDYIIRKSLGKTVKMPEIIPIERVSAWIRNYKAKRIAAKAMEVATRVQQQNRGNINKPLRRN